MSLTIVDILFAITVILLAFNGWKNGALVSLISLLGLPIAIAAAYFFGPTLTASLASSGIPATPLISYAVLFVGTILVTHLLSSAIRGTIKKLPLISPFDTLLGAVVGFVEAWAIWLTLLIIIGIFLNDIQTALEQHTNPFSGINITFTQFKQWHDWYNDTVTHSLFAQINGLFVKVLPAAPEPKPLSSKPMAL